MKIQIQSLLALLSVLSLASAFSAVSTSRSTLALQAETHHGNGNDGDNHSQIRRDIFRSCIAAAAFGPSIPAFAEEPITSTKNEGGVTMYKTSSGLKYIELTPSPNPNAKSPRYGQLCIITYTAYLKLPNDKEKQKFDSTADFIIKHGNGKMLPGLDEGLHTMKVGSTRRIIIPPKLGFVESGLGPMPVYPWNRAKLNRLLDAMIEQRGGNLIFDVTLTKVLDDEADQGYYEDESLSGPELDALLQRLNKNNGV